MSSSVSRAIRSSSDWMGVRWMGVDTVSDVSMLLIELYNEIN